MTFINDRDLAHKFERSGKLTKWEDLPFYVLLTTVIDQ